MAYRKVEMGEKKLVKRLHKSGISIHEIVRQTGLSRNTVRGYLRDDQLTEPCQDSTSDRYDHFTELLSYLETELQRKGVTRQLLWLEYKQQHPEGYGYSQFCYHLQEYLKRTDVTLHIEQKPGDKLYVDFTGWKLEIVNRNTGEVTKQEVFVGVLGYSGFAYVEACDSQQKQDFLHCLENNLRYIAGVPAVIVPDNLKSAVTKADNYEPDLNRNLQEFSEHHSVAILPARSRKPRDKAWVERMVGFVYTRVFAPLRNQVFYDQSSLNQALWEKLDELNNLPLQKRPESRRQLLEQDERSLLKVLNAERYMVREYARATVMKNSHILLSRDKHYYSVPYQYVGKKVKITFTRDHVSVFLNHQLIAFHQRDRRPYKYTTVAAHLPSTHQVILDWNPEKFIKQASKISEEVEAYVREILERKHYPEQAYRSCAGLLNLGRKYGHQRLTKACQRASFFGNYGYKTIGNILKNNYDQLPDLPAQSQKELPFHDNIRGANNYK